MTPDVLAVSPHRLGSLRDYYLDGPADIAIEVLLPGHEDQDRLLKRRYYAAGGVPEYWIVDPLKQMFDPLRLVDGSYRSQPLSEDGRYRPKSVPGLSLVLERLWSGLEEDGWGVPVAARRCSRWRGGQVPQPSVTVAAAFAGETSPSILSRVWNRSAAVEV